MADIQDWKEAARAELSGRLEGALAEAKKYLNEETAAREKRMQSEEDAMEIVAAARTLGISLAKAPLNLGADAGAKEMTAREIILEALKGAYPKPMKAAELRKVIEQKIGRAVHYKTAGMTLYRLSDDKLVRREGHGWFAVEGDQLRLDPEDERRRLLSD